MAIKFTNTRVERLKYDPKGSKLQRIWDNEVPGLGLEVSKTGRKSWIFKYRIGGKQRLFVFGHLVDKSLREARDEALSKRQQVNDGIDPKAFKSQQRENTPTTLFEAYIKTPYFKSRSIDFQNNFPCSIKRYLLPAIGNQPLHSIKRKQIRTLIDGLIEEGKEGAARGFLTHSRILFNYGIDLDFLEYSPADKIKPKYTTTGKRVATLSDDQIKAAWHFPMTMQTRGIIRWCLLTGCRRDEARTADWSQFENGIWRVEKTKSRKGEIKPLILPITPMMQSVMDEMRATFSFSDYLFPATTSNRKPIPRGSIYYQLQHPSKSDWSLHWLRHVVETQLAELGVTEEHRDLILNHARKSTGARYNHSQQLKVKEEALLKWHEHLQQIVS